MTLGNVGKAQSSDFAGKRKLLLIPYIVAVHDDGELVDMVRTYWSDAIAQVRKLERGLGNVSRVFHEGVAESGEAAIEALLSGNPHGQAYLQTLVEDGATFEATEDIEDLFEAMDLHRCMSVVQASNRVAERLLRWFEESRKARYAAIAERIDSRLESNGVGVLVVSPDHDMQLPGDIEAVYVVPPVLDRINAWLRDHQTAGLAARSSPGPEDDTPGWAKR